MATEQYVNFGTSTLTTTLLGTSTDTLVKVASIASYPTSVPFRLTIDNEIMLCTASSAGTATVSRGQESTTISTHTNATPVIHCLTTGAMKQILIDGSPVLKSSFVLTSEATASTTFTSLTTPDSIIFTLSTTAIVLIKFTASVSNNGAVNTGYAIVNLNGTNQGIGGVTSLSSGFGGVSAAACQSTLTAGTHTALVKYHTDGVSFSWWDRSISAYVTP